jgi:homopolymeric O-antigen transport system permease protein
LRDLLRELVSREIKLKYKRSVLGIGWSLMTPIAQLLVFYFVFELALPLRIPNYIVFLFTGVLVWTWFQSSLMIATGAVVDNRELIKRPGFPAAILPAVTVTTHLIHFLVAFPILLILSVHRSVNITGAIFGIPFIIALQLTLTLGLAYLAASLHVRFRDTQYLVGVLLQMLFFLTPVFYDVSTIPERYRWVYRLNPMVHLLDAYRGILIHGKMPDVVSMAALALAAACLVYVGYVVFVRASYKFAEEL